MGRQRRWVTGGIAHETDRGQTVLDFAIGAGVLLITVGVVFTFVPSIFEPFTSAGSSAPIGADRVATHLTTQLLAADAATPSALDAACTAAFFAGDGGLSDEADCGFDADDPVEELVGVDERDIQVAVLDLEDPPRGGTPIERSVEDTTYTLSRESGGTPTNVAVASRIVSIDGDSYRLVVKVW